jgi:hypothetical protein
MRDRLRPFIELALAAGFLSACAPPLLGPTQGEEQRPAGFPDAYYQRAAERGDPIFAIDAKRSLIVIEVRRGGTLAQAGHDHVVASHDVQGFAAPKEARADLYIQLDRLVVDEPELRNEAGFDTQISEAAITATRANMLGRVLHVEEHPFALVSIAGVDANGYLDVAITLNGVTRNKRIPAEMETSADELRVAGSLGLDQSDFGIAPLSLLGGAIQVQDRVNVRFSIRAHGLVSHRGGAVRAHQIRMHWSAIVTTSTALRHSSVPHRLRSCGLLPRSQANSFTPANGTRLDSHLCDGCNRRPSY